MRYVFQPTAPPAERHVRRRWSSADDSDMTQRYLAGEHVIEIAAAMGRTPQAVAVRATRLQVHRCARLTPHQEAQALQMLTDGDTQCNVAAQLGVDQSTISRLSRKHG